MYHMHNFNKGLIKVSIIFLWAVWVWSPLASAEESEVDTTFWDSTCNFFMATGQCIQGAGRFVARVGDFVFVEPVREVHDDCIAVYFMATADKEGARQWVANGKAWSNFSKAVHVYTLQNRDDSFVELAGGFGIKLATQTGTAFVNMPYEFKQAWDTGDYETVGDLGANMLSVLVPAAYGLSGVTFTIPKNLITYVPVVEGNEFALAAVASNAITIEGIEIPAGATLGIFMSKTETIIFGGDEGPTGQKGAVQPDSTQFVKKIREYREKEAAGTFKPGEQEKMLTELEKMLGSENPPAPLKAIPGDGGLPFDEGISKKPSVTPSLQDELKGGIKGLLEELKKRRALMEELKKTGKGKGAHGKGEWGLNDQGGEPPTGGFIDIGASGV